MAEYTMSQEFQRKQVLTKMKHLCRQLCETIDLDSESAEYFLLDLADDISWVLANHFPDEEFYMPHPTEDGDIKDMYKKGELNYD